MAKVKIICLVIAFMGVVWANRLDDPKDSLEVVGSLEFPGNPARSLFVRDSFAYVACDSTYGPPRGLRLFVVNVSNPALPETVGSCFMSGSPRGIWVKDSIAYIAAGIGMQIVNISNPNSPQLVGSFTAPVRDIEVVDSYAYLACGDSGLYIVNVSDPSQPKLIGCFRERVVWSLSIQVPYAYTVNTGYYFSIINISDTTDLYIVGECYVDAADWTVTVDIDYAYAGSLQFAVVNTQDSTNPTSIVYYPDTVYPYTFGSIVSIFFNSGYAYIASEYAPDFPYAFCGLIILNVCDPSQPTLSVRYGGQYDNGQDVFVENRLVYTCFNYGLLILRHIITEVEEGPKTKPVAMKLFSNLPNPFRRTTRIQFQLPKQSLVNLKVYDVSGRLIKTLIQTEMAPGVHTLYWDGKNGRGLQSPSGVYFIYLNTARLSLTKKAILLR